MFINITQYLVYFFSFTISKKCNFLNYLHGSIKVLQNTYKQICLLKYLNIDELEQVLDAIFMFAGLTSLMSSGAHAAAAHAIYEGFTVCDKTREFGHGLLVGFGNLCLLALENRSDEELLEAIGLARACAIPLSLREIAELDSTELAGIIDMALHAPDMANMPAPVTAGALYSAIARVEHQAGLL